MQVKGLLFLSSAIVFIVFTFFSYTVAKEYWQQIDFDVTVKLQDRIPRKLDDILSIFSLVGSVEVTFLATAICALISLLRLRIMALVGWSMIVPASIVEVFGKLVLFHPGTPFFLQRAVDLGTNLPSFYIHTNFSYPSGHMTRIVFLTTIFFILTLIYIRNVLLKFIYISFLVGLVFIMAVSRVYLGEHWLSDVIGGTMLGMSVGLFGAIFIIRKTSITNHKNETESQIGGLQA